MPPATSCVSAMPERHLRAGIRRQVVIVCLSSSLLLSLGAIAGMSRLPLGLTVHVSADGRTLTQLSFSRTVGDVLAAAKVTLHPGDRVDPAPDTPIWPDMQISVLRTVPLTLAVGGGAARPERVAARTVRDALHVLDVAVGPLDRVYPDPATAIWRGMRVTVERRERRTWTEYAAIPYPSEVVNDRSLFRGNEAVRSAGKPGTKARTVRVLYADGRPVSVAPLAWTVVRPPAPRVLAIGTRAMIASRGEFAGRQFMVLEATAYYPGPDNYGGGVGPRTAIGMVAQHGIAAVDPSLIPLGSRLYIDGYGYAVAADTGGAIHGMRIDLCYNTYNEAMRFGRRPVKVYILDKR